MRDEDRIDEVRRSAESAFTRLGMRHMARIDGFLGEQVTITDVNGIGPVLVSFVWPPENDDVITHLTHGIGDAVQHRHAVDVDKSFVLTHAAAGAAGQHGAQ